MSSKFFCFHRQQFFFLLLILAVLTRFVGLSWGNGSSFQPDENNMASAITRLRPGNFNPEFFAYGQFPLYLSYFSGKTVDMVMGKTISAPLSFSMSILHLRLWSAFFSVLGFIFFYKLNSKLFTSNWQINVSSLLYIFQPGLIQLSHFGTTESVLIFVFIFNLYISFRLVETIIPEAKLYILSGIITGLGLASKISALIFATPILVSTILSIFKKGNHKILLVLYLFQYFFTTALFFALLSPYNFFSPDALIGSLKYETGVATGLTKVFYTRQFENTIPYLFQFIDIFPYAIGLPGLVFSIFGLLNLHRTSINQKLFFVFLISVGIYFMYFGQVFTRWTRFVSPVFVIFPVLVATFLDFQKNKFVKYIFTALSIIPGIIFINIYLKPDIRQTASNWIVSHIPARSSVISEAGHVVDLPVVSHNLSINNIDFYNLEPDNKIKYQLIDALYKSDYIIVPSRRIFGSHNNNSYPFTQNYYQNLFDGSLGFELVAKFNPTADLFLDGEKAEETWTVFDHPTIRIFKKNRQLTVIEYQNLLLK